ncbi:MAG: hypothetical protein WCP12_06555 [bacterium]
MKDNANQHIQQLRMATRNTLDKIRNSPGYIETAAEFDHEYAVARAQNSIGSPYAPPPTPSFYHSNIPTFQFKKGLT